ncbi:MAG: glucose PTS transporter subunit IIA, partial [Steroidobacteraceae bacterium]
MSTRSFILSAPLRGWSAPLEETPDEVFATRMLGDGVAIDPTEGTLHAPCDGELILIAAARHAVTLRTIEGCEVLLHVGIDTVALGGEGFTAHVPQGAQVRSGDPLLSFDLDLLARRARSLLTPVIIAADAGFRILRRAVGREIAAGEFLMEITRSAGPEAAVSHLGSAPAQMPGRRVEVAFEHGIHARPAALLAASLKRLAADVRVRAHDREANARST